MARVATLERTLFEMRSNQAKKLNWAGLVADGTGNSGVISGTDGTLLTVNGINSLNNFSKSQLINASSPSTTSTSYVDVPGSSMATLTLADTTYVLIYFSITGLVNAFPNSFLNVQYVDGSTQLQDVFVTGSNSTSVSQDPGTLVVTPTYAVDDEFAFFMQFVQLSAGDHDFKLQMKVTTGGSTGYLDDWLIGYIVFGT